jgi:hypothetical protein
MGMDSEGQLAGSGDRLEDGIGGFGPAEGLRRGVVAGDEGGDRLLQVLDAAVDTAANLSLREEREPAFELIEPGGVGRCEV